MSLVAGAIAKQENLASAFKDIAFLMGGAVTAFVLHAFIFYPLLLFCTLRTNPFSYLKFLIPAQTFAFACASSAATLPVTLKCVERSGQVPANIRNFVLSLGSTINMDGTACYLPMTVTFMAVNAGLKNKLDAATYILIAIMATFGSIGTAPVPSASLVIMLTTYSTAFGDDAIPSGFAYIVAIDWLMDRYPYEPLVHIIIVILISVNL
jgi:Na+/H+-dicarboxylate symporter